MSGKDELAKQINAAYDRLKDLRVRERELNSHDLSNLRTESDVEWAKSIRKNMIDVAHEIQDVHDEIERLNLLVKLEGK